MLKNWVYSVFTKYSFEHSNNIVIHYSARFLQKILGLAVFNYEDVKVLAGPVGYLDRFIILNYSINPIVTHALTQYLPDGGVFLDIGANHGVLSLIAAKNPNVKVFAFEPSPRELHRLWKNLQLNKTNNISVLAYGIGDRETRQDLVLTSLKNPGKNSLPQIREEGKKVSCHFATLTHLLSADILSQARICKLDVEGQEMIILNALRSHMHLFKQCVFIVEISPKLLPKVGSTAEAIYQFFDEAGFKYQFGNPDNVDQWDEFFYHPDYVPELII